MLITAPLIQGQRTESRIVRLPSAQAEVWRCDLVVVADAPVVISDLPTVVVSLAAGGWRADWFTSDWGCEFTPAGEILDHPIRLGVRSGRSSKGIHPWVCLSDGEGQALIISVAWSGNWRIDLKPTGSTVEVRAGISPWMFERKLAPGDIFEAPTVYLSRAATRSQAAAGLAGAFSRSAAIRSSRVPEAWNHWWPYEDVEINEEVFLANARVAAGIGLDLATLDAGWFGTADPDTFWENLRGDWDQENTVRFPNGVAGLADQVKNIGLDFGIWCELEAIGPDSEVSRRLPEVLAQDADGHGLGYLCLGSPRGWAHAYQMVDDLLTRTGARWLKVDFNLDPGAGCQRSDHGHQVGDGLYEHYLGLYRLLDQLRHTYPELIIEGCSSGGLRMDLGLASHLHCLFLSDPDWTEFHLQLLWGACQMLPAAGIFHFSESQWRTFHRNQNLDLKQISDADLDASIQAVSLHRYALSLPLMDADQVRLDRISAHLRVHAERVVPLLEQHSVIEALTGQPLRDGRGERWPVFQLRGETDQVILALALEGHGETQVIRPRGLDPAAEYRIELLGPGGDQNDLPELVAEGSVLTGERLSRGLVLRRSGAAKSWLISLTATQTGSLAAVVSRETPLWLVRSVKEK